MEDAGWAANEFREIDLGDKRRTKRLIQPAEQRSGNPSGSISASCETASATKAAYRLLDNEAVGAEFLRHADQAACKAQMEIRFAPVVIVHPLGGRKKISLLCIYGRSWHKKWTPPPM